MEKLDLILESNRNEISKFDSILAEANKIFNMEMEKFINLQIACSEALINAIVHGNKEDKSKKVYTSIVFDESEFVVWIKDEGDGFNIDEIPDPTSNENLLKESGRGIYIIRSLVDEFHCSSDSNGTEYTLKVIKR
ncbi:MAG TPA: ATP-binding protein [Ignavibacteria bacterium]|nr:ATP-binding protein [Ignavibacteria bacterium]HMR39715.1 ATP-binding protein [Ignavibacteria bacterium]